MSTRRIPIPLSLRYKRMRDRFVPILAFVVCAALTIWLWDRHMGTALVIGEAEVVRVDLTSPVDGVLIALSGQPLDRFDTVHAGQIIARLDDRPTLAGLATLQARTSQSRQEIAAAEAEIAQARADVQRRDAIDLAELILEVQRQRLDIVDRRGTIEADRIELQRVTEEYENIRRLREREAETDFAVRIAQLRRDVLARQIAEHEQALAEAELQLLESEQQLESLPERLDAELDILLEPLRQAIEVHEAEMRELELRVSLLQIRAPFDGEVAAVHLHPGQAVTPGQPILTLADPRARSVVVYFRDHQLVWPEEGMRVFVFPKHDPSNVFETSIVNIATQVEALPERHRNDAMVPEWGLPVRIALPQEAILRPGELVGVQLAP